MKVQHESYPGSARPRNERGMGRRRPPSRLLPGLLALPAFLAPLPRWGGPVGTGAAGAAWESASSAFAQGLPTDRPLYLRGTFNAWRDVLPFSRLDGRTLQAVVDFSAGRHEFKIADSMWSTVLGVDASRTRRLGVGESAPLVGAQGASANSVIEVRAPGSYVFRLSASDGEGPRLIVSYGGPGQRPVLPFEPSVVKEWLGFRSAVRSRDAGDGARAYEFFSDAPQRDAPSPATVRFQENAGKPRLRSGSDMLDGLFALAVHEAGLNETRSIRDGAFNGGGGIGCECYVTGEKWGYVWTRDTSYASHLGLGWLDPRRTWNSLRFKISSTRAGGGGTEIVQDTGTGGSWPVSTDRVTWALGAQGVLDGLPLGGERDGVRAQALEALRNTLERDRTSVFDARDGLYRGEQSFLDWREQTYPLWTRSLVTAIADGKSLSTNVAHYLALRQAASWARSRGEGEASSRYDGWADALRGAIRSAFLEPERQGGALAALRLGAAYPITLPGRYELLGTSLAIVSGVVTPEEGRRALGRYPVSDAGAPVVWPQSAEVPIYHNRALWPFVTAYAARAGAASGHVRFAASQLESLVRGAALNLSHMENLEFGTGFAQYFDGSFTGPVINSRRQLWSVAAFLSAMRDTIFGVRLSEGEVSFSPFLPAVFAAKYAPSSGVVRLERLPLRGKHVDLTLRLPPIRSSSADAVFDDVQRVFVDGAPREVAALSLDGLREGAQIEIELGEARVRGGELSTVAMANPFEPTADEKAGYLAPATPAIASWERASGGGVVLRFDSRGARGTVWDVYRNGALVRSGIASGEFLDEAAGDGPARRCYVVMQRNLRTGVVSHPSPESCLGMGTVVQREALRRARAPWREGFGLEPFDYSPAADGAHLMTFQYSNSYGDVTTGITAATRRVRVTRASDGVVVGEGVVAMPHMARWDLRGTSSGFVVDLSAGERYSVVTQDFFNMSYLAHYVLYDGAGGRSGPLNSAVVHQADVTPLERAGARERIATSR